MDTRTRMIGLAASTALCCALAPAVAGAETLAIAPTRDLTFASSARGVAAAQGMILTTADGGRAWYAYRLPESYRLLRGAAYQPGSTTVCVVVGESGSVIRTANGGRSWTSQSIPDAADRLNAVAWANSSTVIAVGSAYDTSLKKTIGVVWRSTDAGKTWTRTPHPGMAALTAVAIAGNSGMATSADWIMRTSDGGVNWLMGSGRTAWGFNDLIASGGRTWALGSPSGFPARTLIAWSSDLFATSAAGGYVHLQPTVSLIRGALAPGAAWMVGNSGTNGYEGAAAVFASAEGVSSWAPVTTPLSNVEAVGSGGGTHVVLAGSDSSGRGLWHSSDRGASWTAVRTATVGAPPAVSLTTPALSVSTPRKGSAFTISGRVSPKHEGSVKLTLRRKVSGSYQTYKTVTLTLAPKTTYSSYSYRATLPYAGSWQVKASSAGTGSRLPATSAPRSFTVAR